MPRGRPPGSRNRGRGRRRAPLVVPEGQVLYQKNN